MKYRIKIITYGSGKKEYLSYVKGKLWGWNGLNWHGFTDSWPCECKSREDALSVIDKHYDFYQNNRKVQSIDFEYITK